MREGALPGARGVGRRGRAGGKPVIQWGSRRRRVRGFVSSVRSPSADEDSRERPVLLTQVVINNKLMREHKRRRYRRVVENTLYGRAASGLSICTGRVLSRSAALYLSSHDPIRERGSGISLGGINATRASRPASPRSPSCSLPRE